MNVRFSLKFIALSWILLLAIIGGLLYNAYSKFKPETFIALLTEQVQKNYPGTKLNVGRISYKFSLDFSLNLEDIHIRRTGKLLGSIGEIELKVPWWLLLTNRGSAQINLSRLDIYVDHEAPHQIKAPVSQPSQKLIEVSLPNYLADAKFTLRAKEVSIRDIHNSRRYFTFSKLLVREFHYGKNSAFELNVPISIRHAGTVYSSDLWLFGDLTPETQLWKLNFRGEMRTRESNDKYQLDDVVIVGDAAFTPSDLAVSSNIRLLIEKDEVGTGKLNADNEALNLELSLKKVPFSYFGIINEEIKNPYLNMLDGEVGGELKFSKSFVDHTADLNGKFSFGGGLVLAPTYTIPGKWVINVQNTKWEISFISPKGEASFFRRSAFDLKTNSINQYVEEIGFSGLELPKVIAPLQSLAEFTGAQDSIFHSTTVSFKDCVLDNLVFNGTFRYGNRPDQRFYTGDLSQGNTTFKVNFSQKSGENAFSLEASKFPWRSDFKFLEPYFSAKSSLLSGKVDGRWAADPVAGQWLVNFRVENSIEMNGLFPKFVKDTFSFFRIDPSNYLNQSYALSNRNNVITLDSLSLEGPDAAKISGSLSVKQKSYLVFSAPKAKPLKKEVIEPYWIQKDTK
jgi:hypothetical protein